jgi:hypothetical protein
MFLLPQVHLSKATIIPKNEVLCLPRQNVLHVLQQRHEYKKKKKNILATCKLLEECQSILDKWSADHHPTYKEA